MLQPAPSGGLGEGVEHALLMVDAGDDGRGWREREGGAAAAGADVEHAAAGLQPFPGQRVGGRVGHRFVGGAEQLDRVDPGRLWRRGEDLVRDPPVGQVSGPPLSGVM
ncbi:MAG TPA: hypothetical protein VHN80_15005 [Kineosporiaceae bacterium]|nr:hypothetical protein [Kineosporiaceae bacterium]